jgi:hypothetical protein
MMITNYAHRDSVRILEAEIERMRAALEIIRDALPPNDRIRGVCDVVLEFKASRRTYYFGSDDVI